ARHDSIQFNSNSFEYIDPNTFSNIICLSAQIVEVSKNKTSFRITKDPTTASTPRITFGGAIK
ncbi:hypothetical protein KI387_031190, partial [Taxus chinensis]